MTVGRIPINRVVRALAIQIAAVALQMGDQIAPLHAAGVSIVIVSQIALPGASFLAFSR
jgi:hypothetical protein